VARLDEPGRLQLGDRLAHDRAAHAERLHDRDLGRQLLARLQAAVADAIADRLDELEREAA